MGTILFDLNIAYKSVYDIHQSLCYKINKIKDIF
jgi:hypothetical protein